MKALICFLLFFSLFGNCANSSDNEQQVELDTNSIIGVWQLVEIYGSSGGGDWGATLIKDGHTYEFREDSIFKTTRNANCSNGNYVMNIGKDSLWLFFDNAQLCGIKQLMLLTFDVEGEGSGNLLSINSAEITCDEGCDYRYKKIDE